MSAARFSVIQAQREGKPVLIVLDTALQPAWATAYPWLLTVKIPMRHADGSGLCAQAESSRLDQLEDELLELLDQRDHHYVGHVTGNGRREILLYASDPERLTATLTEALHRNGESSADVSRQHDPDWAFYRQFPVSQ